MITQEFQNRVRVTNEGQINMSGFSFKGVLVISYDNIVELIGEPNPGDGEKTDASWLITFDGEPFEIYNWKDGKNYLGAEGLEVEDITNWHIGGRDYDKAVEFIGFFHSTTAVNDGNHNVVDAVNLIQQVLGEYIFNKNIFTAFDITKEARTRTSQNIRHDDVRSTVMIAFSAVFSADEFHTLVPDGDDIRYDCKSMTMDIPGNPKAIVYFPIGCNPADHPSVKVDEDTNDSTDDDNTDEDDVVYSTKEGRINIPKKVLDQIVLVSGEYTIRINGIDCRVIPNADGRVRLNYKSDKCVITADTDKNLIEIVSD